MHIYMHIIPDAPLRVGRDANIAKHGIDFITAVRVFDDGAAYVYASPLSETEQRFVIVGMVEGLVMAVVYTERGANTRIISARVARRQERARHG